MGVLQYWLDIESLTPASDDKSTDKISVSSTTGGIDWANGKTDDRDLKRLVNVVRLGLFNTKVAADDIILVLGTDGDEETDSRDKGGVSFLAAFLVDAEGKVLKDSLKTTLFAVRYETLEEDKLPSPADLEKRKTEIGEAFDSMWARSDAAPLAADTLGDVLGWFQQTLRRTPPLMGLDNTLPYATITRAFRGKDDDDDVIGIVDSLLYTDIHRVLAASTSGRISRPLVDYLAANDLPKDERLNADAKETIERASMPMAIPLGKWPSRGEKGHPLVLRQQMAVNIALSMTNGGLFSVTSSRP